MTRIALMVLVAGCSVNTSGLLPSDDGGPDASADVERPDAELVDGDLPDGALPDGALPDGALPDAALPDAEGPDAPTPVDAGPDAPPDAGTDAPPPTDAGPDVPPPADAGPDVPADAGCTFADRCATETSLEQCVGGVPVLTNCSAICQTVAGGAACFEWLPTNVGDAFVAPEPALTIDASRWDTDACDSLPGYFGVLSQPGARDLCVLSFGGDVTLQGEIVVAGSLPLAIVSTDVITIDGSLRADARGQEGGPGGLDAGSELTVGDLTGGRAGVSNGYGDGGGGGGAFARSGGDGGGGRRAGGGAGGMAIAAAYELVPLRGGNRGGFGSPTTGGARGGAPGAGGGAVQLVARGGIVLNGVIDVSGGQGLGGRSGELFLQDVGSGGGGGSGGGVSLETLGAITVGVDSFILAGGAGGGGGGGCPGAGAPANGGNGGVDTVDEEPLGGAAGSACGGGGFDIGGDGGAGGETGAGTIGETRNDVDGGNGGGGGGGAGLVVRRSRGGGALNHTGVLREADLNLVEE